MAKLTIKLFNHKPSVLNEQKLFKSTLVIK